jgi:hypothetical protein
MHTRSLVLRLARAPRTPGARAAASSSPHRQGRPRVPAASKPGRHLQRQRRQEQPGRPSAQPARQAPLVARSDSRRGQDPGTGWWTRERLQARARGITTRDCCRAARRAPRELAAGAGGACAPGAPAGHPCARACAMDQVKPPRCQAARPMYLGHRWPVFVCYRVRSTLRCNSSGRSACTWGAQAGVGEVRTAHLGRRITPWAPLAATKQSHSRCGRRPAVGSARGICKTQKSHH